DTLARRCIRMRRGAGRQREPRRAASQNIATQVLIFHDIGELRAYVGTIDLDRFPLEVRAFKGNLLEQLLHDGMEAARAYILGSLIHLGGKTGDLLQRIVSED